MGTKRLPEWPFDFEKLLILIAITNNFFGYVSAVSFQVFPLRGQRLNFRRTLSFTAAQIIVQRPQILGAHCILAV